MTVQLRTIYFWTIKVKSPIQAIPFNFEVTIIDEKRRITFYIMKLFEMLRKIYVQALRVKNKMDGLAYKKSRMLYNLFI